MTMNQQSHTTLAHDSEPQISAALTGEEGNGHDVAALDAGVCPYQCDDGWLPEENYSGFAFSSLREEEKWIRDGCPPGRYPQKPEDFVFLRPCFFCNEEAIVYSVENEPEGGMSYAAITQLLISEGATRDDLYPAECHIWTLMGDTIRLIEIGPDTWQMEVPLSWWKLDFKFLEELSKA